MGDVVCGSVGERRRWPLEEGGRGESWLFDTGSFSFTVSVLEMERQFTVAAHQCQALFTRNVYLITTINM